MATCFRHPARETGVACSSCDRPICPDCMTPTPVGMRCPECAGQRTRVHTVRSMERYPVVTRALIAINAIAFLGEIAGGTQLLGTVRGSVFEHGALYGPSIQFGHEYWRLLTAGFLHAGLIHIGFNMYLLWMVGRMLEPAIGSVRFAVLYITSLLSGSFGALLLNAGSVSVGASGAVFGIMGATVVVMRARGFDPRSSGLVPLIVINLILTFTIPGISAGAHVGGLIGGAIAGWLLEQRAGRGSVAQHLPVAACVALAAIAVAGSIAVA
jgi:membrane associated rhomboid family serine protease